MRITGGEFRGRIIRAPANLPVRPTTDFAKTALFNILSNHFDFGNLSVLDLFAGAGSISYEFASRKAKSVTCVDENNNCINFIKKTSKDFGMEGITCVRSDVFKYLKQNDRKYDIIFADPPFALDTTDHIPEIVFEKNMLNQNGILIIEHQAKRTLQTQLIPYDVRKYSNCAFSFFRKEI